jgi:hypothetical protein
VGGKGGTQVKARRVKNRDYSMHLLSVDSKAKVILGAFAIDEISDTVSETIMPGIHLPAITTNGRVSFLPIGTEEDFVRIQRQFRERIKERYPKERWPDVCTYVCAAVVLAGGAESIGVIFEVWGFTEPMPELEQIYSLLADVGAKMERDRTEVENFLSSKPIKSWVNALIEFLKQQTNWTEYVDKAYRQLTGEAEKTV